MATNPPKALAMVPTSEGLPTLNPSYKEMSGAIPIEVREILDWRGWCHQTLIYGDMWHILDHTQYMVFNHIVSPLGIERISHLSLLSPML